MPFIDEYVKADGTRVRSHYRWPPGARRQLAILVGVAAAVLVMSESGGAAGNSDGTPRQPRPMTTTYPIQWEGMEEQAARSAPKPTVSYPIRFPGMERKARPVPKPTVSYPIPWVRGEQ